MPSEQLSTYDVSRYWLALGNSSMNADYHCSGTIFDCIGSGVKKSLVDNAKLTSYSNCGLVLCIWAHVHCTASMMRICTPYVCKY